MHFESNSTTGTGLLKVLSAVAGSKMVDGKLMLPENIGQGYVRSIELGPLMRMTIHRCEFKEDLSLNRIGSLQEKNEITFSFRNVFSENDSRLMPSVQVSSSDMDVEVFIAAGTKINVILISVHVDLLKNLLNENNENLLLNHMISGHQPFLYDEIVSPEIRHVAKKIAEASGPAQLNDFFLKLKAQEMIYLFFVELTKREEVVSYPLNAIDVHMMYAIKDKILQDLSVPPVMEELVLFSHMSESKMNRLFKQIFGNSIFNYYQRSRMDEAAYLIKDQRLSVSEVGYRMGFTNLSHFTRLFEKHIGLKPKKYSNSSSSFHGTHYSH
ncbi:hypothetical protein DBR11_24570 [Pedobacter sp. HMWF019]|uniref:helix-turn-helix transcriptional regulator n=1 Tax=Pedobacter sp. HMWF019 TaxID=2056856 RepID=UPI000D3D058C|nr:AraC family transcriptional regulator [Pedobacter sp. HMWF019]PTS93821.1 hypothetical protein DBR11_24570 [Pedobacter sp. HMWF019]